MLLIKSIPE